MANLIYIPNDLQLTDNLVPKLYDFNTAHTYSVVGTGTAENQLGYSYSGAGSLRLNNLDNQNTDLVASLYTTPVALEDSGNYNFSLYLQNGNFEIGDLIQIEMYKGGVLFNTFDISPYDDNVPSSVTNWKRYGQSFNNSGGLNNYTFKVIMKANSGSATNDKSIYIDGFKIELNDKGLGLPSAYTEAKVLELETTTTIDVPNIVDGTTATVTATLTGAIVGDYVQMVYPVALITAGLEVLQPVVTDDDEIKFLIRNNTGADVNPASADYSFKIVR